VKKIAIIPTLFTLGNGVCGFGAITFAARIPRGSDSLDATAIQWLWYSGVLILAAMVFDMLDGRVARLTRWTSDFGGQLDSLCDCISFGVAPAFLLLKLCADSNRYTPNSLWIKGLWVIAVLYVVCAAMRLARFNVENDHGAEKHLVFKGLPSPAAAGAIASAALLRHELRDPPLDWLLGTIHLEARHVEQALDIGLPLATVALAVLMVSRVPYPHVTNQMLRGRKPFTHLVKIVFAVVAIVLLRELFVPLVFWGFALGSPIALAWRIVAHRQPSQEPLTGRGG
jgi:CDP-diacylglycerol--serine O-phosphatidyltransferase